MMSDQLLYRTPLVSRYTTREHQIIWGELNRWTTARHLWASVAENQMRLGVEAITMEMVDGLRAHLEDIDFGRVAEVEKKKRHDVMSHVLVYGEAVPKAAGIIHYGLTSCDITDNAELIQIRSALGLVRTLLARVLSRMAKLAREHRALAIVGSTHYQNAQPVTFGKRLVLWAQELLISLKDLERVDRELRFRGLKGVTGTQNSLLKIFGGDAQKVRVLDQEVTAQFGFDRSFTITGQTYTRKQDVAVLQVLASLATSVYKIAQDIRLLQHDGEVAEPFEEEQVGSTGMPQKKNPMRSERADSLARHVVSMSMEAHWTHATQILERSLDDSAGRRIYIPEAFLTTEALLLLLQNIFEGLRVYPGVMARRLREELPFLISEEVMVEVVRAGGDRQKAHEHFRVHAQASAEATRELGEPNSLVERVNGDEFFAPVRKLIPGMLDADRHVGLAPAQVDEFLKKELDPALEPYAGQLNGRAEIKV